MGKKFVCRQTWSMPSPRPDLQTMFGAHGTVQSGPGDHGTATHRAAPRVFGFVEMGSDQEGPGGPSQALNWQSSRGRSLAEPSTRPSRRKGRAGGPLRAAGGGGGGRGGYGCGRAAIAY